MSSSSLGSFNILPPNIIAQDKTTRAEEFSRLVGMGSCDVAIIGGGIHAAAAARICSGLGLTTVMLEQADYGSATSSRSSKMAHGGLRYLEMFDFGQVFEGIKAREEWFEIACHLVSPAPFLIPVPQSHWFFRAKLGLGLKLYDWFVLNRARKHQWLSFSDVSQLLPTRYRSPIMGCYQYWDGVMNDCRLVLENVLAARRSGALCLNYTKVEAISGLSKKTSEITWRDTISGRSGRIAAKVVINCAGPWVREVENGASCGKDDLVDLEPETPQVIFSRGVHLVFQQKWTGPAVFLPLAEKARYYWVWPHPAGAMVGTTECQTDELELDPQPRAEEIDLVLQRVLEDLPESGLNRDSLFYAFAGIRTLPLRKMGNATNSQYPGQNRAGQAGVAQLSRKHIWHQNGRMLSLYGGKFTTAGKTACQGVALALKLLGRAGSPKQIWSQRLPGAIDYLAIREKFLFFAESNGLAPDLALRLVNRYGSRVQALMSAEAITPLGSHSVLGELQLAMSTEQAETVEDVIRRRLELEYLPGCGVDVLASVSAALKQSAAGNSVTEESIDRQQAEFLGRLKLLTTSMGKPN